MIRALADGRRGASRRGPLIHEDLPRHVQDFGGVKRELTWIDKRALLLLHEESLAMFGGAGGIRDEGLLDSALARPVNQFLNDENSDCAALAAAYGHGIAKNRAFVDGNKRAAFLSIGLFLTINGERLTADRVDATQTLLAVAAGTLEETGLARWIRANVARAQGIRSN
jgi:death-on-curing protein